MGFDGLTHADSFFPQGMSKNSRYHQVFVAFDPNLFKSSRNRGTWDLTDNDMLAQKGKDGIRGAIQFLPNGKADILATKEANATTFIHEMAHLVRRTMLDEGDKDIIHRWMFKPEEYNKLKGEAIRQAEQAKAMAPDAVDVDELAGAAEAVMCKLHRVPAEIVCGLTLKPSAEGSKPLLRDPARDLFR